MDRKSNTMLGCDEDAALGIPVEVSILYWGIFEREIFIVRSVEPETPTISRSR